MHLSDIRPYEVARCVDGGVANGSDGYAAPVGATDENGNTILRPRAYSRSIAKAESGVELYDAVYTLNPLSELEGTAVVALTKAVVSAAIHCGGGPYDAHIELAEDFYDQKRRQTPIGATILPRRDATVLHVYTQETKLYKGLNGALGDYGEGGRGALPQYFELVKLLIIAAMKLPALPPVTVYRGVPRHFVDLLGDLSVGGKLTWWSFTSTTRMYREPPTSFETTSSLASDQQTLTALFDPR